MGNAVCYYYFLPSVHPSDMTAALSLLGALVFQVFSSNSQVFGWTIIQENNIIINNHNNNNNDYNIQTIKRGRQTIRTRTNNIN